MPAQRSNRRPVVARALAKGGSAALRAAERFSENGGPTLAGDRWVEWSFCLARLADGPGDTMDFGADIGFLSLAAAQRGHRVIAFDRLPSSLEYEHDLVTHVQGDILEDAPGDRAFDQILNCSSVEHVGLGGRYGSPDAPEGDLQAMDIMRGLLAPGGRMIMTVPVGRDMICNPFHRIYGTDRLERLTAGYEVAEEQYWRKPPGEPRWRHVDRAEALSEVGSERFYALGLFVLTTG